MVRLNLVKYETHEDPFLEDARRLHTALLKSGKVYIQAVNLKRWAESLRKTSSRFGEDKYQRLLLWYINNLGESYLPKVHSGRSFMCKFVAIEAAMIRAGELRAVTISKDAKRVVKLAGDLKWPGDEKEQELKFIQLCINNWKKFHESLEELKTTSTSSRHDQYQGEFGIVLRMLCDRIRDTDPNEFAAEWLKETWGLAMHWSKWNGELEPFVFTISSPRFNSQMESICRQICGYSWPWYEIKERLQRGEGT